MLKATGLIAASGALGLSGLSRANAAVTGQKPITIAGYAFDRIAALADGRVSVDGCDVAFEKARIGDMNTHVFSGPGTRDVSEVGLHPYMLAYANEGFRDYVLLPVFPLRTFRHKSIFIRNDRGITKPEDLKGKTVATPGFSSTSLTWLRGILEHEHGVRPSTIKWVVAAADSSAGTSGGPSKQEKVVPEGLEVQEGPAGKDESDLLADGDVDALLHAAEPKCYLEGDPNVSRLYPDFRRAEQAYFRKTDIFPIMHVVAMRKETVEANPGLPAALFRAYSESKQIAYWDLRNLAWAFNSLPWVSQEVEDTQALMGDNFWPYGIDANRKVLDTLFQYSYEQGLAGRRLQVEDLFHPSTLDFTEA